MSLIVTLLVASSFVNDGLRKRLVTVLRRLEPRSTAAAGRDARYLLFVLRPLPLVPPPPRPQSPPLLPPALSGRLRSLADCDAARSFVAATAKAVGVDPQALNALLVRTVDSGSWLASLFALNFPQRTPVGGFAGAGAPAVGAAARGSFLVAGDALPFAAPSLARRVVAWSIDSLILTAATSVLRNSPLRGIVSAALWLTRDFWLSPWGFQSPGRWAVGQVAVATDLVREINWAQAPPRRRKSAPTPYKTPADARSLTPPQAAVSLDATKEAAHRAAVSAAVPRFKMALEQHDKDIYTMVCYNSLRLFVAALGPVGSLIFAVSTLPAISAVGDGRTLWDRWMRVQVLNEEDIVCWAYGCTTEDQKHAGGGDAAVENQSPGEFVE